MRIVVMNDHADTLEGLVAALGDAGYETIPQPARLNTIDELEHFIVQHDPQLVVYDVAPPYAESMRRWRELCSRPTLANLPFVLTTTWPGLSVMNHECAVVAVISKPMTFEEVVRAVRVACRPTS